MLATYNFIVMGKFEGRAGGVYLPTFKLKTFIFVSKTSRLHFRGKYYILLAILLGILLVIRTSWCS